MVDYTQRARTLRQNQTEAEKKLWFHLKNRQINNLKFRRQHPIPPYITDFFCEELGLIVELDGGQHTPEKDKERTVFLEEQGYRIIRFWNNDILENIEGVLEVLSEKTSPSPKPSPRGEGLRRVCLGKITGAHGIKGLVKVLPYGEDASLLERLSPLYTSENGSDTLSLTFKNPQGKFILAAIEGVLDKNAADLLRNTELWVLRSDLPEPEEDEYYFEDLKGMSATTSNGNAFGVISDVADYGAGAILNIKRADGSQIMIPFSADTVGTIDLEEKSLEILNAEDYAVDDTS